MKCSAFLAAAALTAALPLGAAVTGVVVNQTTGKPVPQIPVTLLSASQGMDVIGEVYTDADGAFSFDREPVDQSGKRVLGMLRAEYEGVNFSKPLPPMLPLTDAQVEVTDVLEELPTPSGRVLVLEPGEKELVVNESYLFENNRTPPATYRDPNRGSLRFYLPPEAKGIVQVEASGPARMPLNATADQTKEPNVRKVDFPIKPGENRISLTYLVPRPAEGQPYVVHSLYDDLQTRLAAPAGITVEGAGLTNLGAEPSTQAQILELPRRREVSLVLSGQGQLQRSGGGAAGATPTSQPNQITIGQPPVSKELPWILGVAGAILAIGFVYLYSAQQPSGATAKGRKA